MKIVAQAITVHWTKASRGAPASVVRNQVPEAFPVSQSELHCRGELYSQHVSAHEAGNFEPTVRKGIHWSTRPEGVFIFDACELSLNDVIVKVRFRGGGVVHKPNGVDAFRLTSQSWGRLRFNHRDVDHHGSWSYTKTVMNIALVAEISHEMFSGKPTYESSFMDDLF